MKELIVALMLWIGANTNYNVDWPVPQVIRMDKAPLEYHYYKGDVPENTDVHGFYDLKKKIIYMRGETDMSDPWAKGLLLDRLNATNHGNCFFQRFFDPHLKGHS